MQQRMAYNFQTTYFTARHSVNHTHVHGNMLRQIINGTFPSN